MLKLTVGAKVMLTVNLNLQDRPINGQTRTIRYIELAPASVEKVYVKLSDEQGGLKSIRSSYPGRQNSWTPMDKCKAATTINKLACPFIKRIQFALT